VKKIYETTEIKQKENKMKVRYLITTAFIFSSFLSPALAQEQEMPPPPRDNKEAIREYEKAQQLFEQYRLSAPFSEEQAKEIIGFFSQIDPEIEDEMKLLKSRNLREYQERLRQMEKEMRYLSRLQEEPERFEQAIVLRKLEVQCNKLAREYHKSNDDTKKSQLEQEIKEKLVQLFEMKEQEKELEIARIMDRVDKMRQEMKERKANKDKIIELRLNELTGKEHLSRW
jgi:hypothetical protein